jgi:ferrochelatase
VFKNKMMNSNKTAILLINVGTPDSPSVKDVRKYLSEFLNDPKVISIPWLLRKILVNLIIVPFRAPKSSKLYQLLWTEKGSPLLFQSKSVREKLQNLLGNHSTVFLGMRYGNPNLINELKQIQTMRFDKLIVIPMFPQYATSTSGTAIEAVKKQLSKLKSTTEVTFINQFYNNSQFLNAFAKRINNYNINNYDHIIFSYHGLPLSHINAIHPKVDSEKCNCHEILPEHGKNCYKATCYETTRLLANKLGLTNDKYSVSFQSRLTKNWLSPFTDKLLINKANEGVKNILIVAPSFVSDCLETNVELGIEYKKLFIQFGGTKLDFVESLNDMDEWIYALKCLVQNDMTIN